MENLNMENVEIMDGNETPKRPMFLSVLCVLTFIASGLSALSNLLVPMFADKFTEFMKSAPNYDEAQMEEAIRVLNSGWGYYSIMVVLAIASLVGAILMWKLKKIGFHIYTLANMAALFVPMLMFSVALSWTGIFFTAIFIVLYAVNLKHLK